MDFNGNIWWNYRESTISWMKTNGKKAFVKVGNSKAYCKSLSNGRINYLETYPDATKRDNLLSLPQF